MKNLLLALILVTYSYTCQPGDNLQNIAERNCDNKNPKAVAEFREGIRQLNYHTLGETEVWPGMVIQINKWTEEGNTK